MRRNAKRASLAILVVLFVSLFFVSVFSVSSFAHPDKIPVHADPTNGYIEIWANENGNWNLIINTSSSETQDVPANTELLVSAKPVYGFSFYGLDYSTNLTSGVWNFLSASNMPQFASFVSGFPVNLGLQPAYETTVTAPSEFIAEFPAQLEFLPDYIFDSDYNALWNVSFYGQLVYVVNGSPVPNAQSLLPYFSNLNVKGVGAYNGQTYTASFPIEYVWSGNYFYVDNKEVANIGSSNYIDGLESKSATITFNSPDPSVYASGTIFSPTNWGWGDTVEFISENSLIEYSWQPFSGVSISGQSLYNKTSVTYFPTGEAITIMDTPATGLVFENMQEGSLEISHGITGFSASVSSQANPWEYTLSSTPPQPGYVYAFEPTLGVTSVSFTITNVIGNYVIQGTLTITAPNGATHVESFSIEPPNSQVPNQMSFTLTKIPTGTYTWSISPASGTYTLLGNTYTYTASPSSGSFTLSQTTPTFSQTVIYGSNVKYATVTFTSNLPSGVPWSVDFAGTTESSTSPTITFTNIPYPPNGVTYSYSVPAQITDNGYVYKASSSSGSVAVRGNTNVNVNYNTYVTVNVELNPSASGTISPTLTVIPLGGTVTIRYSPDVGWVYQSTEIQSGSVSVGSVSQGTTGGEYYYNIPITAYTPATVIINGIETTFTADFATYYQYSSSPSFTYSVDVYEGSQLVGSVTGSAPNKLSITGLYAETQYTWVFQPSPDVNNVEYRPSSLYSKGPDVISYSSTSGTFEFTADTQNQSTTAIETYNQYDYITVNANGGGSVSPSSGWFLYNSQQSFTASAYSGWYFESWSSSLGPVQGYSDTSNPIVVNTAEPATITANFGENTVTFHESGLPNGITWCVSMDGYTVYSTTPYTITFYAIPTGTYSYSVSPSSPYYYGGDYYIGQTSGTLSVSQGSNSYTVSYTKAYPVTLSVSGGSGSISWSNAYGTAYPSSGSTSGTTIYMTSGAEVEVTASPNSGYSFNGWSSSGYVSVSYSYSTRDNPTYFTDSGGSGSIMANFQSDYYSYTWYESGLSGQTWGISVNGNTYSTSGSSLTEQFTKGNSYPWSVSIPSGYEASPTSGTISGQGSTTIDFTKSVSVSLSASPTSGNYPLTVSFTASGSGGFGPYQYDFYADNGQTSGWQSSNTWSYTYSSGGSYYPYVVIKDAHGNTAVSNYVTITVTTLPLFVSISASTMSGNAPLTVQFYSYPRGGNGQYTYSWTFGDGGTSTSANPSHTYSSPGTYYVSLYITSSNGNQQAYSNTITITVHSSTYSHTWTISGSSPPAGSEWLYANGGYHSGSSVTINGLSGTVSWRAETITKYLGRGIYAKWTPSPSSGSVSGSGTTTVTYTYSTFRI
ncbi:MAG: PKD domain-containing protein [Nitrososphaerota archaeon]|jgi:PKD repeat protein|nr:PKD domain-containing protein [Nitrososphaerota archaeon]MDG6935615.1 PKD domain-containing protein [Nitrososphaerota archaeon]MDG6944892.1 PKD domain-containing protein [Nitrososphaerota archaeon]